LSLVALEFFQIIPRYNIFFEYDFYENFSYLIITLFAELVIIMFSFFASDLSQKELEEKMIKEINMKESLIKTQKRLEGINKELKDKMELLEKINRVTIGRELRMIELKKRIKELENIK
jgi:hypothetical protein